MKTVGTPGKKHPISHSVSSVSRAKSLESKGGGTN